VPTSPRSFSNFGFDESPFDLEHWGDVRVVVGAVCARTRLDGVLIVGGVERGASRGRP
jgi:hypothetical protein